MEGAVRGSDESSYYVCSGDPTRPISNFVPIPVGSTLTLHVLISRVCKNHYNNYIVKLAEQRSVFYLSTIDFAG